MKCVAFALMSCVLLAQVPSARASRAKFFRHEGASKLWLSDDGFLLVSQSDSNAREKWRMWDLSSEKPIDVGALQKEKGVFIKALAFDGKSLCVQTVPKRGTVERSAYEIWRVQGRRLTRSAVIAPKVGNSWLAVALQKDKCLLLSNEAIETRDLSGRLLRRVGLNVRAESFPPEATSEQTNNGGCAISPDGRWALASVGRESGVFDARTGRLHHRLQKEPYSSADAEYGINGSARFSSDGQFLMGGQTHWQKLYDVQEGPSIMVTYSIWSAKDGSLVWPNCCQKPQPLSDGHCVASGLDLWDVHNGERWIRLSVPWEAGNDRKLKDVQVAAKCALWVALDENGNIALRRNE